MTVYTMHFSWPAEVEERSKPGPMSLSSKTQAGAMRQARQLWEVQPFDPAAKGYRLVHGATGVVVYEYRRPG